MKKVAIVFFLAVGLVLLGSALILPRYVTVERKIVVDTTPDVVYGHVANLKNWPAWSPWKAKDPDMKMTYSGADGEIGSSAAWQSESQGNGTMTISALIPNREFENQLDFGDQGTGVGKFWFVPEGDEKTEVIWSLKADMGNNPIGKLFGLAMDGMVGADFEDGLGRLKKVAEAGPASAAESDDVAESAEANAAATENGAEQE